MTEKGSLKVKTVVEGFGGTQRTEYRHKRRISKDLQKDLQRWNLLVGVHSSCFLLSFFLDTFFPGAAPGAALALVATTLLQLQKKALWSSQVTQVVLCKIDISHKRVIYIYILYIIAVLLLFLLRPYNRYTCICVTEADARTLEQRQRSPHRKQLYSRYSLYKQDVRCAATTNSPLTLRSFLSHVH